MSTLLTCTSTTRPASPSDGDMLYETDTYKTIISYNSVWREYLSETSPYDLDGTNTMSIRPMWHFDAGKINGVDSSGNPADGASLGDWLPVHTESKGEKLLTASTSSLQPTWQDGSATDPSGFNSKPHIYFDGGDEIAFRNRITAMGGWNIMMVCQSYAKTSNWGGFTPYIMAEKNRSTTMSFGGLGPWSGRYYDVMQFYGAVDAGYNSSANSGQPSWFNNSYEYYHGISMLSFEQNPIGHVDGGGLLYLNGNNPCSVRTNAARLYPMHFAGIGGGNYDPNGYIFEFILFTNSGNSRAGDAPLTTADKNAWNAYVRTKYNISSGASGAGIVDF